MLQSLFTSQALCLLAPMPTGEAAMKCLIIQPVHEAGLQALRDAGITPVFPASPLMADVAAAIPGVDGVITRDAGFSAQAFDASDILRAVVVHGTGHDAVDKVAAGKKGVLVANTPGANARSVAELAVGLALAVARRISAADAWERSGKAGFRESAVFTELSGKTALIVGWGAIGRDTGRMLATAFGMDVIVYSPRVADTGGFEKVSTLAEGLARADLISLHTPLREETRNLIGAESLKAVKPGALLVNVARAGVVDEAALAGALSDGRIAGAGLDVYSHDAPHGPLAAFDQVVFTPHLGATTEEALRRVALGAAQSVITALRGEVPATALNADQWRFKP